MANNCLKTVHVPDQAALKRLCKGLRLDEDFGGLGAWRNIPEFGLVRGWRVVETRAVSDLHKVIDIEVPEGGIDLVFFNTFNGEGLDRICNLFTIKGVSVDMVHLDAMHIMDLGVAQLVIGKVFWELCNRNFARSNGRTKVMRMKENLWHLRRRLKAYYLGLGPARKSVSKVGKITYKMFQPVGKKTKYARLRAKAGETRSLIAILPMLCRESQEFLGPRKLHLTRACDFLAKVYSALKGRRQMTPAAVSDFQSKIGICKQAQEAPLETSSHSGT